MPIFVGYSSIGVNQPRTIVQTGIDGGIGGIVTPAKTIKKFRLVDEQLVIRDFINAFNIKQGDKVGQPSYGTTIWSYVFEPSTIDIRQEIESEVRRVASLDPRITMNTIAVYQAENGILIELEMAVSPFNNAVQAQFLLNKFTGLATRLA
jgi:phage baseplate assembly protein W